MYPQIYCVQCSMLLLGGFPILTKRRTFPSLTSFMIRVLSMDPFFVPFLYPWLSHAEGVSSIVVDCNYHPQLIYLIVLPPFFLVSCYWVNPVYFCPTLFYDFLLPTHPVSSKRLVYRFFSGLVELGLCVVADYILVLYISNKWMSWPLVILGRQNGAPLFFCQSSNTHFQEPATDLGSLGVHSSYRYPSSLFFGRLSWHCTLLIVDVFGVIISFTQR